MRKAQFIAEVPGLTMKPKTVGFNQVGDLKAFKDYCTQLANGPEPFSCVVFMDEVEKTFGGSSVQGFESSGTSTDAFAVSLKEIQARKYPGCTLVGPPGTGKTYIAEAIATEFGVPCLEADIGATKNKFVGNSEERIRNMWAAIFAMAGQGGALIIATCNKLESVPPEMRRRLASLGIWFFELPDENGRKMVGEMYAKDLTKKPNPKFWESCEGWSSSDIYNVCRVARKLNISVEQAAPLYIVPAAKQDPDGLANLRAIADGKFLDANKGGMYSAPIMKDAARAREAGGRRLGATLN